MRLLVLKGDWRGSAAFDVFCQNSADLILYVLRIFGVKICFFSDLSPKYLVE